MHTFIFIELGFSYKCHFYSTEVPDHLADLWLESVAMGTMHTYTEEILKIPQLTAHGCKQLVTDIGQFGEISLHIV